MKTNNLDNFSDDRVVDILSPRFAPQPTSNLKSLHPYRAAVVFGNLHALEVLPQ